MLKEALRRYLKAISLILAGTIVWSATMVKSGLMYSYGLGFWGPNGHDGIWHIALIRSLINGSYNIPVFAGEALKNYHLGFDLFVVVLFKITHISPLVLYFQIIPPILAFFIGILTYKFVLIWRKSNLAAFWATFFVYFGGSFGWLVNLLRNNSLEGESLFWSQQSISTLINPPFAFSLVLILLGLIYLIKVINQPKRSYLIIAIISFGLLAQIKIYASLLVLSSLFMVIFLSVLFHKYLVHKYVIKIFLGSAFMSLILFFVFNRNSAGLIVFQPFWFLETMMAYSDRLGWFRFYSAMTNYKSGHVWLKAIPAYIISFIIFWIGNMGTRIIQKLLIINWIKNFKKLTWLEVFFVILIVIGVVIPMLFLQKGTPWNTIQFFYYSLFFSGILAGISLASYLQSPKITKTFKNLMVISLVMTTLPTTFATLGQYLPARPPAKLSTLELQALNFLAKQPQGVVLTYPFDQDKAKEAENNPPRPLYLYESTAYVAAFSGKPVYLEDQVNLDITGYNWPERRLKVTIFLNSLNAAEAREFLGTNNIKYIYWHKGERAKLGEGTLGLVRIFENKEVDIYQVAKCNNTVCY